MIKKEGGTKYLYAIMPPIATTVADIPSTSLLLIVIFILNNYLLI
jgi:hypothetical protein